MWLSFKMHLKENGKLVFVGIKSVFDLVWLDVDDVIGRYHLRIGN